MKSFALALLAGLTLICFVGLLLVSGRVARLEERVAWLLMAQGHE